MLEMNSEFIASIKSRLWWELMCPRVKRGDLVQVGNGGQAVHWKEKKGEKHISKNEIIHKNRAEYENIHSNENLEGEVQ